MAEEKTITHSEFVEGYKSNKLLVYVDKTKAGDFVLSPFADKRNKPTHLFWSWLGIILALPLPIILLFFDWRFTFISFILGLVIINTARKNAAQSVLQNMLDDEDFYLYVLLHGGAKITNESGKTLAGGTSLEDLSRLINTKDKH